MLETQQPGKNLNKQLNEFEDKFLLRYEYIYSLFDNIKVSHSYILYYVRIFEHSATIVRCPVN
jgi:hypothetical protein